MFPLTVMYNRQVLSTEMHVVFKMGTRSGRCKGLEKYVACEVMEVSIFFYLVRNKCEAAKICGNILALCLEIIPVGNNNHIAVNSSQLLRSGKVNEWKSEGDKKHNKW